MTVQDKILLLLKLLRDQVKGEVVIKMTLMREVEGIGVRASRTTTTGVDFRRARVLFLM